jgi:hypothetical protein
LATTAHSLYKQIRWLFTLLAKQWLKSSSQWQIPRQWLRFEFFNEHGICWKLEMFKSFGWKISRYKRWLEENSCIWKDNVNNTNGSYKTYHESVKWLRVGYSGGLCNEVPLSTEFTQREILGQVSNLHLVKEYSVCFFTNN